MPKPEKLRRAKCGVNPFAVCRSRQNQYHWSNEKTERCIKQIKKVCPQWENTAP